MTLRPAGTRTFAKSAAAPWGRARNQSAISLRAARAFASESTNFNWSAADQLKFVDSDAKALAARNEIALWFLALPHGAAADFAKVLVPAGRKVIDLSADFRIADVATYEKYYGQHHAPELLAKARYVLPE